MHSLLGVACKTFDVVSDDIIKIFNGINCVGYDMTTSKNYSKMGFPVLFINSLYNVDHPVFFLDLHSLKVCDSYPCKKIIFAHNTIWVSQNRYANMRDLFHKYDVVSINSDVSDIVQRVWGKQSLTIQEYFDGGRKQTGQSVSEEDKKTDLRVSAAG